MLEHCLCARCNNEITRGPGPWTTNNFYIDEVCRMLGVTPHTKKGKYKAYRLTKKAWIEIYYGVMKFVEPKKYKEDKEKNHWINYYDIKGGTRKENQ